MLDRRSRPLSVEALRNLTGGFFASVIPLLAAVSVMLAVTPLLQLRLARSPTELNRL